MPEHQPRQVVHGSANGGEAPDLGPLQEAAEAAELAAAMSGPTDGSGGPFTVRDSLRLLPVRSPGR